MDEATLLDALRPAVSRAVFDAAVAQLVEARRARVSGGGAGGGGVSEVGVPAVGRGKWSVVRV